jgi:hypothetical protein
MCPAGKLWHGDCDAQTPLEMRDGYLTRWSNAQWYLVPAPGEQSEADGLVQCAVLNDPDEMVGGVDDDEGDDS